MVENRPSKKQRELLSFIDGFIKGNGYGPSYREIMRALDYKSVSTVAVHVDGLIARELLRKTDHSARSLEIVGLTISDPVAKSHLAWLKDEIKKRSNSSEKDQKETKVLHQALKILDPSARDNLS